MKQYFSVDSILFTIISVALIAVGATVPLLILYTLSIIFLIIKSGLGKKRPKKADDAGIWGIFFFGLLAGYFVGVPLFGVGVILLILFLFWCRVLYYTIFGS